MSGYNGVLPDMRALITRHISVVDRTPITVKFVDNPAHIGYSFSILSSTVAWFFLVLPMR